MAGEKSSESTEPQQCSQGALYVFISTTAISVAACIVLLYFMSRLKRRQNGYAVIRGNEDEVQKYKDFYLEEKTKKENALSKLKAYKDMYEDEKREKEDALQRLSKLMSNRLTDGNPNVANLNDAKRPTKLADELSELYDNEWTGAFESIDCKDEKEKIGLLLNILQISFGWCKLHANGQLQKLKCLVLYPGEAGVRTTVDISVNQDVMKSFKDARKLLAEETGAYVSEKVLEAVKETFKGSEWESTLVQKSIEVYCRKCAELSWFLAVQDPPMDIKFADVKAEDVKAYTKSGNEMDFVVWPPLYLHEKGSLMSKGIAQFRIK